MRTLIAVFALAGMSLFSVADTTADTMQACLKAATTVEQQQDCCKANKGVCGCRAGKIVCCDKTFADNCSC
jgi:hypothetical protein